MEIYGERISHFFFFAAAAARAVTACAAAGAFRAIGTADALLAAFPGLPDEPAGKAKDQGNNGNNNIIDRIHRLISFR